MPANYLRQNLLLELTRNDACGYDKLIAHACMYVYMYVHETMSAIECLI